MKKLILFDIDHTLMDARGAGGRAINQAFASTLGVTDAFRHVRMDGKTDIQIVQEGLLASQAPVDKGIIDKIIVHYLKNLTSEIRKADSVVLPGVPELLQRLDAHPACILGLLTGNIEPGANIKLKQFDLEKYFVIGAFGSDHQDRNMLLPIAVDKFHKLSGQTISPADCIVIGDTPRDVECGRLHGAQTIAVATGVYTREELETSGADHVLDDLQQPAGDDKLFAELFT